MKPSDNCLELIKQFEGLRLQGYICPAGVPTIGYGYTGAVNGKRITTATKISAQQAEDFLRQDLERFAKHVDKFGKYNWTQNEFDALVSFAYNVGSINQLTKNGQRSKAQIAAAMPQYNKGGGKVLPGLVKRRRAEQELFLRKEASKKVEVKAEKKKLKINVDGKQSEIDTLFSENQNCPVLRQICSAMYAKSVELKGDVVYIKTK